MGQTEPDGIHIAVIVGSVRPGNYTSMAVALVIDELQKQSGIKVTVHEPGKMNLPFPGQGSDTPEKEVLQETISKATGVILATPGYHGSFSSVIKLFIENLGFPSVLATKPVSLLGVAAGEIGAIKSLEQLRSVCSHIGAIVLPGPVSVANVQKVFDEKGHCLIPEIEKRIRRLPVQLIDYIRQTICPSIALEDLVRMMSA